MKMDTQERTDGVWLSKEELTNLMESMAKEARDEEDEVKKAFAYGKAVLAKDLLCRIKETENKKEPKTKIFAGVEDGELIFYNNNRQHKIRISSDELLAGCVVPRTYMGPKYIWSEYEDDSDYLDSIF